MSFLLTSMINSSCDSYLIIYASPKCIISKCLQYPYTLDKALNRTSLTPFMDNAPPCPEIDLSGNTICFMSAADPDYPATSKRKD